MDRIMKDLEETIEKKDRFSFEDDMIISVPHVCKKETL